MSATDLLKEYWFFMPVAVLFDALILGGMSYGLWRSLRRWVLHR